MNTTETSQPIAKRSSSLGAFVRTMRPKQWVKNGVIFAALVFDRQFNPAHQQAVLHTMVGFIIFCLISGLVYVFNDIADVESDRQHPEKKKRPIAAGVLSIRAAWWASILLTVLIFPLSYLLSPAFTLVGAAYFVLNLAYSKWLKHIPLVDVMSIAAGFVLRVAAGVVLIKVARFSPWLYVVMTLASLYIGFGKRRSELALLDKGASSHRKVLDGYTLPLLDQFITIVSATTIISYSLYTFSAPNLPQNHVMMLTIPFVIYGILRYLYLLQIKHSGGAPEEVFLSDHPLQAVVVLWGVTVILIFYLY